MSFTYGGINTDDLEGVEVTPITYPNMGGLQLDTVETPGRDGRFYGGSRMTTSQLPFRVTISGETQQQADLRRLAFMRVLDPSTGARSLRLDNTANWHYPQAVVAQQIEWEKHADRSKVLYDGEVVFETNFDAAMRQIDPSTVSGVGQIEFIADMGSTVSYPTVIFESGGDIRVRVNDFIVDLYDTPPDTYGILNWDEYKFYTAQPDLQKSLQYRWTGARNASHSVKVLGQELARNYFGNPDFEGTEEYSEYSQYSQFAGIKQVSGAPGGSHVYALQARDPASNHTFNRFQSIIDGPLDNSGWLAISAYARLMQPDSGFQVRVQFHDGSRNRYISLQRVNNTVWQRHVFGTVELPAGATDIQFAFYINNGQSLTDAAPSNAEVHVDKLMVAVADTEQGALAQVEHYFDGDTVGHIVPGERISSLVNAMSHFERPAIYPGDSVEVEVTPIGSNTATPVIVYPNHRRL